MPRRKLCIFFGDRHPLSTGLKVLLESKETLPRIELKKGQFLLMPKMEVEEMHYLASGMVKAYWLNTDNEEEIFALWYANSMAVLPEEFFGKLKNEAFIEVVEDCELLAFSKDQVEMMHKGYPEWPVLMECIRGEITQMRNRQLRLLMQKEGDRYALFCKLLPEQMRLRLTDKDICGYIGISRSTLTLAKREYAGKRDA